MQTCMHSFNMAAVPSTKGEDEVRRKPASCQPPQPPAEAAPNNENYDILVIGRTGMGKSSTVDKLMVLSSQQPLGGNRPITRPHPVPSSATVTVDGHRDKVQCMYEDLLSVLVSDEQAEIDASEKRLKNIVFCRDIEDSHKEIDRMRNSEDDESQDLYKSSSRCHLIVNETSKIRTLDTPGFFTPDHVYGATNTVDSNLAIVRHIIRLQALAGLRFKRTLYFLPQTGPLKRSDRTLQDEIQKLVKFFGMSIFRSMVLVATAPEYISIDPETNLEKKFPQKKLESSRKYFQEALVREFQERRIDVAGLAEPPIIFIAMTDTCQEIFEKIKTARVESDGAPQLEFNSNTCSRCGMEIGMRGDNDTLIVEYRETGTNPWTNAVFYKESSCHPMMLPRYTAKSIQRGIAGLFHLKWYGFTEDLCIRCNQGPGSRGCMKVETVYEEEGHEPITVRHSNKLDKKRAKAKTLPGLSVQ